MKESGVSGSWASVFLLSGQVIQDQNASLFSLALSVIRVAIEAPNSLVTVARC